VVWEFLVYEQAKIKLANSPLFSVFAQRFLDTD